MPYPRCCASLCWTDRASIARRSSRQGGYAFTLIELMVVIGVISILTAILLPALLRARLSARICTVHSDLRQIEVALQIYADDRLFEKVKFPPCHFGCALGSEHCKLPTELIKGGYLDKSLMDPFNPGHTYKYEHPGFGWFGDMPSSRGTFVPNGFPYEDGAGKKYYSEETSPVKYAVWSVGPDGCIELPYVNYDILQFPLRTRYWYPNKTAVQWYDGNWVARTQKRRGIICHAFDGNRWHRSDSWAPR